jgi:F-type H+-transporting ATPase subunit a
LILRLFFSSAVHAAVADTTGHEQASQTVLELPNFITLITKYFHEHAWAQFLHRWENIVFSGVALVLLLAVTIIGARRAAMIPGRFSAAVEWAVESLDRFICDVLGARGRKYVPFLGTLFLYILFMNYMGMVPFLKAPTSALNVTAGLAITVFLYVQYTGVRRLGVIGYLDHFAGEPRSVIQWVLVPLMVPLHVVSELAKPLSLSLRLFGNITGEDVLIYIFAVLGVAALASLGSPVGIPLQVPFIFLSLLLGFIQALVFTLLSTLYFLMMLPHEEH